MAIDKKSRAKAWDIALDLADGLTASDFKYAVTLWHDDGTTLHYEDAFLIKLEDDYILVFTEHFGFHVHAQDELNGWAQYKRVFDFKTRSW